MIQINLLPDVKQEYLRAKRTRNVTISISILAGIGAGAIVVILLLILGVQAGLETLADGKIKEEYAKLSQVEDLSEMVTLQSQLETISSQHNNKTMDSRLFSVIQAINPSAPNSVQYTSVNLDPTEGVLSLEGVAASGYPAVELLKKTIDNTTIEYNEGEDTELRNDSIASQVAIGETSYGENNDGARVLRFEIFVTFHDLLFSNQAKKMRILAPERRIDVTDSRIGVPSSLFTAPIDDEEDN